MKNIGTSRFTVICFTLVILLVGTGHAASPEQKSRFIQQLDALLESSDQARQLIRATPTLAKEVFHEILFDEAFIRFIQGEAQQYGIVASPLTHANWRCLQIISEELQLSPAYLVWFRSYYEADVSKPTMPQDLQPLCHYLQAIQQLHEGNLESYAKLMQECLEESKRASITLGQAHALLGVGLYDTIQKADRKVVQRYEAALRLFERMQAKGSVLVTHLRLYWHAQENVGQRAFREGRLEDASEHFRSGLHYAGKLQDIAKQVTGSIPKV